MATRDLLSEPAWSALGAIEDEDERYDALKAACTRAVVPGEQRFAPNSRAPHILAANLEVVWRVSARRAGHTEVCLNCGTGARSSTCPRAPEHRWASTERP